MRLQDGAILGMLGREFEVHVDVDDEGRHGAWVTCCACSSVLTLSDDAMQDHACYECAGCGESFTTLPVVDAWNGQRFCTDDCHEDASERYWTAVWTG